MNDPPPQSRNFPSFMGTLLGAGAALLVGIKAAPTLLIGHQSIIEGLTMHGFLIQRDEELPLGLIVMRNIKSSLNLYDKRGEPIYAMSIATLRKRIRFESPSKVVMR